MRLALLLIAGCLIPGLNLRAATEPPETDNPSALIRWAFAEADAIEVQYYESPRFKSVTLHPSRAWRQEVDQILTGASFQPQKLCFCVSPALIFRRDGEQIAKMSVHHGHKLRLEIDEQVQDYEVGETVGMAMANAAQSRRKAAQSIKASAEAAAADVIR